MNVNCFDNSKILKVKRIRIITILVSGYMLFHSIAFIEMLFKGDVINSGMYAKFLQHGSQNLTFITIVQNGFTHYALVKMQILEFLVCDDTW